MHRTESCPPAADHGRLLLWNSHRKCSITQNVTESNDKTRYRLLLCWFWEESKNRLTCTIHCPFNDLQVCYVAPVVCGLIIMTKSFTWILAYCREGVTRRQGRNNVQGPGWWDGHIRSQSMTLLFTLSQWLEDYPRASGTGPGHADSVCGFDIGSSQSSAPRELHAATVRMLSGCQRRQTLTTKQPCVHYITLKLHAELIRHITPPALRTTKLSEYNKNKRWTKSFLQWFFTCVIILSFASSVLILAPFLPLKTSGIMTFSFFRMTNTHSARWSITANMK